MRTFSLSAGSVALSLAMVVFLSAAQAATPTTRLAFKYAPQAQSVNRTKYPIIILAHAESGEEVQLARRGGIQILDLMPGAYYLRRVQNDRFDFTGDPMPVPDEPGRLLEVKAGTLTYIGDLRWSSQTGLRLGFSRGSLLKMQKDKSLHGSSLYLSGFGKNPQAVSWE